MTLPTAKISIREYVKGTGTFINDLNVWENNIFKMLVENAGVTNTIQIFGKMSGETSYTLLDSIVGNNSKNINIELYDYLKLTCSVYDAPTNYLQVTGSAFTTAGLVTDGSIITASTNGVKKGLDVNVISDINVAPVAVEELNYIDEASSTVFYFGYAPIGSAESSAVWKVERMTIAGTVIKKEYANGVSTYTNIWNNRVSLSYS
jgi:hypothetical protein